RVIRRHRNHCLYDQRAAVEFLGDEVHAATVFAIAGLQCPLVGMQALVLGQQRRVDVEQAALVVTDEATREDAHETGQYHQVRLEAVDQRHQCRVEGLAALEAGVLQHGGGETGRLG